ncbi:two-component system sensor histidine kinase YesM [Paenibacillus phyllosphaerae]|uniref:Two-component system sensor histidine kinase YesM n=1 Tax=Paenibacillus phyllosphaerae TaxID=274593 RepID=A0A7W5B2Q2_9BACL|nr:sensor histidine kinase [Paenibacillus phyllosphaerae]MBB3113345.1 two-component system sensor histidine kinase YesM [Paenibacillus phyllosphaerae]
MLKTIKDQKLMNRALRFVIAFLILPSLFIFWFANSRASIAIQEQAGAALLELNRQNHATINRRLDAVDATMVSIMSTQQVQRWSAQKELLLRDRVNTYMSTEKLLMDSSRGVKFSLFLLTDNPQDYSFAPNTEISSNGVFFIKPSTIQPWLQQALDHGGAGAVQFVNGFGFQREPATTIAYLRAVVDISDYDNRAFGVFVATEMESELQAELNARSLPKSTEVYLTNTNGNVLAGSSSIASSYFVPEGGKQLMDNIRVTDDTMYLFTDSSAYGTRLVYQIPLDSLIGTHRKLQQIIQIAALGYFIVLSAFLFLFGRSILRPVSRLVRLTRSFEPGIVPVESKEVKRQDEIGFLFRAFYNMMERLNQLVKEKYVMEIKQKESELTLMHSQITPHLLYNTLDSIYWFGLRGGVPEVAGMVRDLSIVLRIGLSKGKEIIPLREEITHMEAYLHLQEKRYNHSFQFRTLVEEDVLEYLVPKVIIQPLVENAIIHGIGKMDGEGELWIRIGAEEDHLIIRVEDNGFRPVNLAKIEALLAGTADKDQGFGIRNVHMRVQLRFGPEFGLSYSIREEGGTIATIKLPLIRSEGEPA